MRDTPAGVVIDVRVIPRAKKTCFGGLRNGQLVVRVAAPPVEGAANDELVQFLAKVFHLTRGDVKIQSGAHSRTKRVTIARVTAAMVTAAANRP